MLLRLRETGGPHDCHKVKGTLKWLSRNDTVDTEVRHYDHFIILEDVSKVEEGKVFLNYVNPESEIIVRKIKVEPVFAKAVSEE